MANVQLQIQDGRVSNLDTTNKNVVHGEGFLAGFTFGVNPSKRTPSNVVGASLRSIDWNCPPQGK